jgi:multimeric flavodoxin WrbA
LFFVVVGGRKVKAVLLSGSPRKGGNTDDCVRYVAEKLSAAGHTSNVVRVCDLNTKPCRGCRTCMKLQCCAIRDDDFEGLWSLVKSAHLVVAASPVYWFGPPGPMKTFIDRTHGYYKAPRPLEGLKAGLLSVAADEGCWEPHEAILSSWLRIYGAQMLPPVHVLAREKGEAMASPKAKAALDAWAEKLLTAL